jgi:poly-gamma-glutamate synthesis protein (capsule biosynthesis protein)
VYVHWGNEYELKHSEQQEALAHYVIDSGIDAVIGHHPHVVQDIEIYNGKPIFYSLGNFIFDQYFSGDVQTGLVVKVYIQKDTITYTLVPISSIGRASQPYIMPIEQKTTFLSMLAGTGEGVGEYGTIHIKR